MDIFRFRKHISVVENNLQFYKLKFEELKASSSEHIQRLLSDVSMWRMKALQNSNDMDEEPLANLDVDAITEEPPEDAPQRIQDG